MDKTCESSQTGVYVRTSTLDQDKGLDSQRHALLAYLKGHGISDATWYSDRVSGATLHRPDFERLQADIFKGKVKTVVCWKLDRLSRSMLDGITVLCNWLTSGVRVVAVSQQFDFSGAVGQLVAGVLFAIAAMERENLRENTRRGLAAARARGVRLGRPPEIDAHQVVLMLRADLNVKEIAGRLGKSPVAIYHCLKRAGLDAKDVPINVPTQQAM